MSDFLTINYVAVPVSATANVEVEYQDHGGEVVRAFAGNLLSSVKGQARVWKVVTPPIAPDDADYYRTMLNTPYAVPCEGAYIGDEVFAYIRALRTRPVASALGTLWVLEFELHERTLMEYDGNLLRNAGFEAGGAYWAPPSANRQYLTDPTKAHSGSGYLEMLGTVQFSTTPYNADGTPLYVPVKPGDVVTFGCWARKISGDGDIGVWMSWYDANKTDLSPTYSDLTDGSGDWEHAELVVTAPAGAAYWRGGPYVFAADGTVGRFDDVYLLIRRAGT